jgi:SDR family mycofactocin-dependent oxidoreductase
VSEQFLRGKVALVTGAGRGQGHNLALRLAKAGADLVLIDICRNVGSAPYPMGRAADLDDTIAAARDYGVRVVTRRGDVRDTDLLTELVADAADEFERLDIVCVNAGIASLAPVGDITDQMWDDMIGINLTGAFKTVRAALPLMRRAGNGGSIVFTTSTAAMTASPNLAAYCASKHGATGLMRVLAKELASESIRVNAVLPTSINTPMIHNEATYSKFMPDRDGADVSRDEIAPILQSLNLLPVPWVEPDDVSDAIMWLVSDAARMITGIQLPVDAGKTVP